MRSRLDEIVDSERENSTYRYSAEGERCRQMRIAERAFRHGVEQAEKAHCVGHKGGSVVGGRRLWDVQPAPAADACEHGEPFTSKGCSRCLSEAMNRAAKEQAAEKPRCRCTWRWQPVCQVHPDRRRDAGWVRWNGRRSGDPRTDRRSNQDRRTPKG